LKATAKRAQNQANKDNTAEGYNADNTIDVVTGQQDPEEESSSNNNEHKEVFTLGQMNTRSQTQVNQYYTQDEVDLEAQLAEITRVEEERLQGPRHEVDSSESDRDSDDDIEPEYNKDDKSDDVVQGDQDVADKNMERF
jgi:hypothetical protein